MLRRRVAKKTDRSFPKPPELEADFFGNSPGTRDKGRRCSRNPERGPVGSRRCLVALAGRYPMCNSPAQRAIQRRLRERIAIDRVGFEKIAECAAVGLGRSLPIALDRIPTVAQAFDIGVAVLA